MAIRHSLRDDCVFAVAPCIPPTEGSTKAINSRTLLSPGTAAAFHGNWNLT